MLALDILPVQKRVAMAALAHARPRDPARAQYLELGRKLCYDPTPPALVVKKALAAD